MPATSKFEHRDLFVAFMKANGVPKAHGNYVTWMNRASKWLGRPIQPDELSNRAAAEILLTKVMNAAAKTTVPFNEFDRTNLISVLRKYAAMVQTNFGGKFSDITPAPTEPATDAGEVPPPVKKKSLVLRVVRDTAMARKIKQLYDYTCQICAVRIELSPNEPYAEAHHLQPLGSKGPDIQENLLCVCPNCHARLDFNALRIGPDTLTSKRHPISQRYVDYHNAGCDRRE